jgi:L,D-transpeptidase ErfK/SrfK
VTQAFGGEQPPVDYAKLRNVVESPDGRVVSLLRTAQEEATPAAPSQPDNIFDELQVSQR